MTDQQLTLFCYLIDQPPFFVDIKIPDIVANLKDKIKKQMAPTLDYLPACALDIWQVSIPIEDGIEETAKLQLASKAPLKFHHLILDVFQRPFPTDVISIVVKAPYTAGETTKKLKQNEVSDLIPAWLLNWHSALWGKAKERPLSRTVVVKGSTYNELREKLAKIPSQDYEMIIQVKRDLLNSLSIATADTNDMDADLDVDADISLPRRITYVDLLDLEPCPRIPQLILYRPEYDELTQAIEQNSKQFGRQAHYDIITGTSGIGMTVYLHLRLAQMLLEAKPVLYQAWSDHVFHLDETITYIGHSEVPKRLASPSHVFVDLDSVNAPAFSIRNLIDGHVIMASPLGDINNHKWRGQKSSLTWVLQNWESEDFWAALSAEFLSLPEDTLDTLSSIFVSSSRIDVDQFCERIRYFGFNPRLCDYAANPYWFEQFIRDATSAMEGVEDIDQLLKILTLHKANQPVIHHLFDLAVGDSLLYYKALFRPRSKWAMDLIMDSLQKKHEKFQVEAIYDLFSPGTEASDFRKKLESAWPQAQRIRSDPLVRGSLASTRAAFGTNGTDKQTNHQESDRLLDDENDERKFYELVTGAF